MKPRIIAAAGFGLAVAALACMSLFLGAASGQTGAGVVHTCSPTDRQFIVAARLSMSALGAASDEYLRGNAKPAEVIDQSRTALTTLGQTRPTDPSLTRTKLVLKVMFLEYQKAIVADAHHHPPGKHIYRAYGLANFAHDLLVHERKPLKERGCDVSPLL
jgi:hypothetical protein